MTMPSLRLSYIYKLSVLGFSLMLSTFALAVDNEIPAWAADYTIQNRETDYITTKKLAERGDPLAQTHLAMMY